MISVVIPICNNHELTDECINNLVEYAASRLDIIVVDNGSITPYKNKDCRTIYNNKNIGFWPAMLQGLEAAYNNIVLLMHNDVLVWEKNFDLRLESHFSKDHLLAICGFFGGRGVGIDGGRGNPEGNMLGRKYGTDITKHGFLLEDSHPALVFDSLAMCVSKRHLELIDYRNIPPYHWTDRVLTLSLVFEGMHARTVGIAFDHGSGATSTRIGPSNNFMQEWCEEHNLPMVENWDRSEERRVGKEC